MVALGEKRGDALMELPIPCAKRLALDITARRQTGSEVLTCATGLV